MIEVNQITAAIESGDVEKLAGIMKQYNLKLVDGKITCDKPELNLYQDYWDKKQLVTKIGLNSIYGILLQTSCRFFDKRFGQSITLGGRQVVKHMSAKVNELITGKYDYIGDAIVYGDTDSVYFTAASSWKKDIENGTIPWDKDSIVSMYDQIGDETNNSFPEFMKKAFNCPEEYGSIIQASREIVAVKGLFITKKRYAVIYYDKEGKRYDTDGKPGKLKAMGLDLKRSDTPKFMQDFLSDTLIKVLTGSSEDDILEDIAQFRIAFKSRPGWEKGSPKRANNVGKFTKLLGQEQAGKINIPGHVRASINWNMLKKINKDLYSMEITDGAKVIVCKLKNNMMGFTSIAYPVDEPHLPEWFKELPFDNEAMEDVIIDNKLDNLLGVLSYNINSTTRANTFESLFDGESIVMDTKPSKKKKSTEQLSTSFGSLFE